LPSKTFFDLFCRSDLVLVFIFRCVCMCFLFCVLFFFPAVFLLLLLIEIRSRSRDDVLIEYDVETASPLRSKQTGFCVESPVGVPGEAVFRLKCDYNGYTGQNFPSKKQTELALKKGSRLSLTRICPLWLRNGRRRKTCTPRNARLLQAAPTRRAVQKRCLKNTLLPRKQAPRSLYEHQNIFDLFVDLILSFIFLVYVFCFFVFFPAGETLHKTQKNRRKDRQRRAR